MNKKPCAGNVKMIPSQDINKLSTPSERLKHIRSLLRVSRAYLHEKYGIPEVTLKSWENNTTKLTRAGARRCVEIYRNEGIIVGEDWVLKGIGLDPTTTTSIGHYFATPTDKDLPSEDEEVSMIIDANLFKENHKDAVIMIVSNNDMSPFYNSGDYIGGKIRSGAELSGIVNKDCIVFLENGEKFFRRVIKNSNGKYNLTCLNPSENTSEPVLYNVNIISAAPVIWHRWKDV